MFHSNELYAYIFVYICIYGNGDMVQQYLFIYMHRILKLLLKDMPIVFIVFMFLALGIMNVL